LSSNSSSGDEEVKKKKQTRAKDKSAESEIGGAGEEGCVPAEKQDVVKV